MSMSRLGVRPLLAIAAAFAITLAGVTQTLAATTQEPLKDPPGGFTFESPLGRFDQASLQRGYKVYAEVCSACHSMNLMYYRNLCQKGGPFWSEKFKKDPNESPYCKAIVADIKVPDIDPDTGDPIQRPATPADHFRNP